MLFLKCNIIFLLYITNLVIRYLHICCKCGIFQLIIYKKLVTI